jgi:hypothetical protein
LYNLCLLFYYNYKPEKDVEDVVLGTGAHGGLVHGAGQQLRVADDDVGVVDAKLLILENSCYKTPYSGK